MCIHQYVIVIICSVFVLFACSPSLQKETVVVLPQSTITPTSTAFLFTPTYEVSSTPTITPTLKYNTPFLDYKGIPVMAGAFHGWDASDWYVFYINTPMDEVEKFYTEELKSNGWTIYQHATDTSNGYGEHGVSLHFKKQNDNEVIQITFVVPDKANFTLVTLAKFRLG